MMKRFYPLLFLYAVSFYLSGCETRHKACPVDLNYQKEAILQKQKEPMSQSHIVERTLYMIVKGFELTRSF